MLARWANEQLMGHPPPTPRAFVNTRDWRQIVVISAHRDSNMADDGMCPICRIETAPACTGQKCLDPGMACQRGRRGVGVPIGIRREIARDITGRNSGQAEQADAQVREILTYSTA